MSRILMSVFRREGRPFFECQWSDPVTGKKRTRSTKTANQREADRFAAKLANDLEDGQAINPDKITWADFRKRYEAEFLAHKAKKTRWKALATLRAVERIIDPKKLIAINARQISLFATQLRNDGREEFTVKGHLAEVRKMLRWAHSQGMLANVPNITMPNPHGMKGRPITREEFERMLAKLAEVVGAGGVASWTRLLMGLWMCGLRIDEAMRLGWADTDDDLWIDLSGRRPLLRIRAHAQKSRDESVVPISQEFGEFLLSIPKAERTGRLFQPRPLSAPFDVPLTTEWVAKLITRIGQKAGVKVGSRPPKKGSEKPRVKWASAHDIRRAFGFRWAMRVMPAVLQQMMRHDSIQTTMEFYVGRAAEAAADALWHSATNDFANTLPDSASQTTEPSSQVQENQQN